MRSLRATGPQIAVLWILIVGAWALALRRGALVPWGSGEGPGQLGTPVWTVIPLTATALLVLGLTVHWWRRGRI